MRLISTSTNELSHEKLPHFGRGSLLAIILFGLDFFGDWMYPPRGDHTLAAVCWDKLWRIGLHEHSCFDLLFKSQCTQYTDEVCYLHRLICYGTVGERSEVFFDNFFLVEMACFCGEDRML